MADSNDVWESPSCGKWAVLEENKGPSGFSEHELLDIMYDACHSSSSGSVLASTIVQYLQALTAQSPGRDRLTALQRLLDPDCQDPRVSRDDFHATMREWISQCSQDSMYVDGSHVSWPDSSKVPENGSVASSASEDPDCSCDGTDPSDAVAELGRAHRVLSEQNISLLGTVTRCEDVNLQLTLEVADLQAKLASAQQSAVRTRSLTEELEETRQAFKEAQEKVSSSQSSCTKLSNEVEALKVHIRRLEDENEKLTFEMTCSEGDINKLREVNAELRAELAETLVTLMLRDSEITKKEILLDKIKNAHVENHNMIEGLQLALKRLQEHSHHVLFRYDRHCVSLCSRDPPNHRSLQSEMQNMEQLHHRGLDDVSLVSQHAHGADIQNIIHRIKSSGFSHLAHNTYPEKDSAAVETEERPFPHRLHQQAHIKQQLVNVLHKCAREEKGEKVEEQWRDWEKEQKQSQTLIQEAKEAAVVNWWKALGAERANTQTTEDQSAQELCETKAKLHQTEQTITDMREQIIHLAASLRSAQERVTEQKFSRALCIDKETNTEREDADRAVGTVVTDRRDEAVLTEISGGTASEQEQTQHQVTTDGLLETLRRMEAMVSNALEAAELVRESEQRVSQVKVRLESITQRVEEALGQTRHSDEQLNLLEARITGKASAQSPGPGLPADPEAGAAAFTAGSSAVPEDGHRAASPPPSAAIPEARESSQPPMNGGTKGGSCSKLREEESHLLQGARPKRSEYISEESSDGLCAADRPFIFPHTRSRLSVLPTMPTLPEEEEDSPEELDSSSSSPSTSTPGESRAVILTAPTIIYPKQATIVQQDGRHLEQARPHSPRARMSRNSSGGPITTVDSTGNVIDLVKDQLPELQLSEEDRQKNLELLEQAKKVSDRFLTRRGRRSTSSLTDSPTGLSPSPTSSPCSSRSSSLTMAPQTVVGSSDVSHVSSQSGQHLEVPSVREQPDVTAQDQEGRLVVDWKPTEKRKVSSGTLTPRFAVQKENFDPVVPKSPPAVNKEDEGAGLGRNSSQVPATGVAKPVPRPPTQQAPCTAEIKTIGAFPPLMRAVSWDAVGSLNSRNGAPGFPPTLEDVFSDNPRDAVFKTSGYKDLPIQPSSVQKLSRLREEHKLMRNQSIGGSKLPDLSETAEQEKGSQLFPVPAGSEEAKERTDAMPNISDVMLRKLKLHRGLPGCAPPLSEKEVENAFVQLSLAFRNDNYTLETRLKQAERERNLTEEDTEKELEEFKGALKMTAPQWQNLEQREAYQRLIETVAVLHRLATRLSSRAEIVGAVRQEKRMNKATEVMMQYVENLKRTYEKDHAELMEFKKLANQNSNRCYGGSIETGDDGVPRASRSMSLTLGKALPRRRVSVAVVPKFNLLNVPGQTPATAGQGPGAGPTTGATLPVLCEANDVKGNTAQPAVECGKSASEQESETAKSSVNTDEIRAEIKAKIEEEVYNKGFQDGLKHSKALQEEKQEETAADKLLESKDKDEESGKKMKTSRTTEEVLVLLGRVCPRISLSRRLLWIALTLFVVMCLVISIFTFFKDYYNRREDT